MLANALKLHLQLLEDLFSWPLHVLMLQNSAQLLS